MLVSASPEITFFKLDFYTQWCPYALTLSLSVLVTRLVTLSGLALIFKPAF